MKAAFGRRADAAALALYRKIVDQARQRAFFEACGVPDTVDGRFDLLVLHLFLVLRRLKGARARTAGFSQALFDVAFEDLDESLRRLGAGDLGVGRRIRDMAEGFYGRVAAYERAVVRGDEDLEACLRRNLFGAGAAEAAQVAALAGYVRREAAGLDGQSIEALMAGQVRFGPPPAGAGHG